MTLKNCIIGLWPDNLKTNAAPNSLNLVRTLRTLAWTAPEADVTLIKFN